MDRPSFDEIFAVMAAASLGDAAARVQVPDELPAAHLPARFATALNLLLDDLAFRAASAERSAERLRMLADASREFAAASRDPHELLDVVARRLSELGGDLCSIRALTEDGQAFEDTGAIHHPDPELAAAARVLLSTPQAVGSGVTGRVAATGQALIIPSISTADFAAATLPRYRPFVERLGITGIIAMPLKSRGQVIGVASLLRSDPEHPFTEQDLRLIESVAEHASLAIANSRSHAAERVAQASYRLMFENSPQPMFVFDPRTLAFVEVNDASVRQYGYARDEFLRLTLEDIWLVEDVARNREAVAKNLPASGPLTVRHRKRDGAICDVELRAHAIPFDGRECRLVLVNDVTERLRAEQARRAAIEDLREARASEATFRGFVEAAPDAVVIVNEKGEIVLVNSQAERLFGYARNELLGQAIEILVPVQPRARHQAHRARYVAEPRARAMGSGLELRGLRKDGSEFPVEISLAPIETEGDTLFASAIRDITERRKADEQRSRLAEIVNASGDAIISKTLEGVVTSWNEGARRLFGYSAEEMVGQSILRLVPQDRVGEEHEILKRLASGNVERFDTVRVHKAGHQVHVSVTSSPVRDASGNLTGVSKVARDIGQRIRAEAAVARAKEAAESANRELEAFSYSVAHDLRAPLRGMNGFAQVLLDTYRDKLDADGQDWLQEILLNARNMGALIDALLSLARLTRSELRRELVDISSMARAVGEQLAVAAPTRSLELSVEPDLSAEADPVLTRALFENLLGNAWKFTAKVPLACVVVGATVKNGARSFFVRDNGVGFDMAFASKLFAPFQRLHTVAEFPGTGIGLATVQRIVHRHGGRIWAEGAVDQGATFFFTLPNRGLEMTR